MCVFKWFVIFFKCLFLRIPGKLTYIWWTYGLLLIDLIQKRTQGKTLSTICLRALENVYFRVKGISVIPSEQCNWNRPGITHTWWEVSLVLFIRIINFNSKSVNWQNNYKILMLISGSFLKNFLHWISPTCKSVTFQVTLPCLIHQHTHLEINLPTFQNELMFA